MVAAKKDRPTLPCPHCKKDGPCTALTCAECGGDLTGLDPRPTKSASKPASKPTASSPRLKVLERTKAVDKPKPTKSGYELGTLTLPGIETAKPLTEEEEQKRYRISERLVKAIFEEETRTLLNAKQYGGWVVEVEQLTVERTFAAAYKFISQVAPSCGGGNYRKLSDDTLRDYRSVHVEWDAVREFVGDDALFNALNLKGFKAELKKLDEKRKKQALADGQAGGDKCGEGEGDGEGGGLDAVAKRKAKADRKQRQLWQKVEKAIGAVYDNATTEAKYLDFDAIDKDANYCSEKALSVKTLRP